MEEENKHITDLKKIKEDVDKMSTKDQYKFMFAKAADERDFKKKNSAGLVKKIINKFKIVEDPEEPNNKPKIIDVIRNNWKETKKTLLIKQNRNL